MQNKPRELPDRRKAFKRMGKWLLGGGGMLTVVYFATGREGPIDEWVEIGALDEFKSGEIQGRLVSVVARRTWLKHSVEKTVWVCRNDDRTVTVLSAVCPHKDYSINWRKDLGAFVCPGHKSAFDPSGKVQSGPSPRPMDSLEHKIENGRLLVRYQKFKRALPNKELFV